MKSRLVAVQAHHSASSLIVVLVSLFHALSSAISEVRNVWRGFGVSRHFKDIRSGLRLYQTTGAP
jgi:hypothetical protein